MIGGAVPETRTPPRAEALEERTRRALERAAAGLAERGLPVPVLEGKLLRPMLALAMVPSSRWDDLDERFWSGALAIQMAHEASLLHDDVLDRADERRGRPTVAAERGAGAALVLGDHYLTASYRAATATGSFEFVSRFAEAVERTVAGEIAQQSAAGRVMSGEEYDDTITGKSGELFGAAAVLGGAVAGMGQAELRHCLGCAFGNFYQRIDDLLDYCAGAGTGKAPLQDFRQRKWSWVLDQAGVASFEVSEEEVVERIFAVRKGRPSAARRALEILHDRQRLLLRHAPRVGADVEALELLLHRCIAAADRGVAAQERAITPSRGPTASRPRGAAHDSEDAVVRRRALALGGPREWAACFGRHAHTFHLAARLFPPREAGLVAGLYAYCRFTDDLVDDPGDDPGPEVLGRRLAAWRRLSLDAFSGARAGVPLLDTVMSEAAERGVARLYPEALLDGVAMDLEPRVYETWDELERYTFGVAGAVGGWMTQLFGLSDPDLLERAHALGHGMQLTNIARDVGEDWHRGRVYLPTELLGAHGLDRETLDAMVHGEEPIPETYRDAVRALLARADAYYEQAWPGIRALPAFVRRPVAAAASAYRGIHREIRRNDYDNLTRRAYTSTARKMLLVGAGLLDGRRAS